MPLCLAAVLAVLAADAPTSSPLPASSPTAELVTVTLAGVAAIITAAAGFNNLRRRRQAELDLDPAPAVDLEDRPSRIRERLTALETRVGIHDHLLEDVQEQLRLRRAVDVATESDAAPHARRRRESGR